MPRQAKPWWWRARKRYAANINGIRHVAPPHIKEGDVVAMARWYEQAKAQAATVPTGAMTFADLCDRYLAWDKKRTEIGQRDPAAHRSLRSKLTTICKSWIGPRQAGDLPIDEYTNGHVQALVDFWIMEGHGSSYIRELAAAVKLVFGWACRESEMRSPLLELHPVKKLDLPTVPDPEPRFAEPVEVAAWLRWLIRNGKHPAYVRLQRCLIWTGARPSEWTRATWGEVNWSSWQLVRKEWKSARKKGKPRRIIIPKRLRRSLQRAYEASGRDKGALLFDTPTGKKWSASNLSTTTQRYREEAVADGVNLSLKGSDRLTCYRWRHTVASALLMKGVDMATAAEMLGTSVAMIQKVYGHLLDSHLADAAERLANRR